MAKRVLVVGAAGDVGQGIVEILLGKGYSVVAAGRNAERLQKLADRLNAGDRLTLATGSVGDEGEAKALLAKAGSIDVAVVSVNAPARVLPILEMSADDFADILRDNLVSHFVAVKAILPTLPEGGIYIGVGGGMADFIFPGLGHQSVVQAGLRNLYKAVAGEAKGPGIVRELLVASMVNGESKRDIAKPQWITDLDIGEHVAAMLAAPQDFPGPVITLSARDQVGKPPPPKPPR